jgi:undecaprenyl-diphosphatase
MLVYILFEKVVINYRPVLINGYLEVSYPSSTTLLCMCVMPTAIIQFKRLIKSKFLSQSVTFSIVIFTAFMVIGRLLSGVHWLSDIIGGILLSAGLVTLYYSVNKSKF